MAADRIEDIGSGSAAAQTRAETKDGLNDSQDQVRTSESGGSGDANPPEIATGTGEGNEDLSPEKATAAEDQQAEVRAAEAADKMDEETEVEDEVNAKHSQIAFTTNDDEISEIEVGDRVVCYCQGNRVVLDVVDKNDDDTFIGINQSSSDFLSTTAQIEHGDRIFFCREDVFSVENKG